MARELQHSGGEGHRRCEQERELGRASAFSISAEDQRLGTGDDYPVDPGIGNLRKFRRISVLEKERDRIGNIGERLPKRPGRI